MADKARFQLFARWLTDTFDATSVFDVAGGQGRLNEELTELGRQCTTFDLRHKHLPVRYERRLFTLDVPCEAELVVGMHPDGATRVIIEYAAHHRIPFAVVPCCSDNSMPYNPWRRYLGELGRELGFDVAEHQLPMRGRATVVWGRLPGAQQ